MFHPRIYKREENRKDLIHWAFVDVIESIFESDWSYIQNFENYLLKNGMKSFRLIEKFKQIRRQCLNDFTDEEIDSIRIRKYFFSTQHKKDYIFQIYEIRDLYDIVDELTENGIISIERRNELCNIIFTSQNEEYDYHKKIYEGIY
jgi:hypothetical protein